MALTEGLTQPCIHTVHIDNDIHTERATVFTILAHRIRHVLLGEYSVNTAMKSRNGRN